MRTHSLTAHKNECCGRHCDWRTLLCPNDRGEHFWVGSNLFNPLPDLDSTPPPLWAGNWWAQLCVKHHSKRCLEFGQISRRSYGPMPPWRRSDEAPVSPAGYEGGLCRSEPRPFLRRVSSCFRGLPIRLARGWFYAGEEQAPPSCYTLESQLLPWRPLTP